MGIFTVLIIDDDRLTRWSVSRILERTGYRVREAKSFAEGTAALEAERPDLILLDVKLPDGDGFALLKSVRARSPELPVIIMTAHASPETAQEAERLGARGHLAKPCNAAALQSLVADALSTGMTPKSSTS